MSEKQTGTIKWFNEAKGFGFLKPDHGDKDLFVHHTQTHGVNLPDGAKVSYIEVSGRKGPEAHDVVVI